MSANNTLITLHEIDGQPLVLDTDLGRELGYGRPEKIRELVQSHQIELLGYGHLPQIRVKSSDPMGRGRPSYAYYLNEEQALLICMFSGAEKAKEIRKQIITVYQAWRKGKLKPAMPDFSNPAEAARAWALEYEKAKALEVENAKWIEEVDTISQTLAKNAVTVPRFMATLDRRINQMQPLP